MSGVHINRLRSVLNTAARLAFTARKSDHVAPPPWSLLAESLGKNPVSAVCIALPLPSWYHPWCRSHDLLHRTTSYCIGLHGDYIGLHRDYIGSQFFNCIGHRVGLGLRMGPPSPLCVRVSSLQDSVRYHADAIWCSKSCDLPGVLRWLIAADTDASTSMYCWNSDVAHSFNLAIPHWVIVCFLWLQPELETLCRVPGFSHINKYDWLVQNMT